MADLCSTWEVMVFSTAESLLADEPRIALGFRLILKVQAPIHREVLETAAHNLAILTNSQRRYEQHLQQLLSVF